VGERNGNLWVIEEGLHLGQHVVVEGFQKVREGVAVTATEFAATPLAQAGAAPPGN
jgi:hypothetical protein